MRQIFQINTDIKRSKKKMILLTGEKHCIECTFYLVFKQLLLKLISFIANDIAIKGCTYYCELMILYFD